MRIKNKVEEFIDLVRGESVLEMFDVESLDELVRLGIAENVEEAKWFGSDEIITEIFKSGCCGRFAKILKFVFPEGDIYQLVGEYHVVFGILDKFYDITGDVTEKYQYCDKVKVTDMKEISDCTNNYCFHHRGPIV